MSMLCGNRVDSRPATKSLSWARSLFMSFGFFQCLLEPLHGDVERARGFRLLRLGRRRWLGRRARAGGGLDPAPSASVNQTKSYIANMVE